MRTLLISVSVAAILFACPSCTRNYTCHCDGGAPGNGVSMGLDSKTKKEAKADCKKYEGSGPVSLHNCRIMEQ